MDLLTKTVAFLAGAPQGKAVQWAQPGSPEPPIIDGSPYRTTLQQAEAERHMQAYGGTHAIDWVYDGIRVYQNQAIKAKYHFERKGKTLVTERTLDTPSDAEEAPADLVSLFRMPNPWQPWHDLLDFLFIDLLAVGNHYWLKFGGADDKPDSLYRMAPQYMSVIPGESRLIDRYEYKLPGMKQPMKIDPRDVVHFRLPNPHSPGGVLGMGLIQAAPRAYDIELGLLDAQASFFENGTMLAGAVSSDRNVSDSTRKKIQREFRALYQGARNFYNVAILSQGLKYSPIQPNAQEAGYQALSEMSRDRILTMLLGASKLLGGAASDEVALSLDDSKRYFSEEIMRPFLDRLEEKISLVLTQAWGVDFKFDYEYVMPEADRLKLGASFSTIPGVRVREVRQKIGLEALGPKEKDPEDPSRLLDDKVLNLPGSSTEGAGGSPDNLPGRSGLVQGDAGGRPADPKNVPALSARRAPASAADRARQQRNGAKAVVSVEAAIAERLAEVGWDSKAIQGDDSGAHALQGDPELFYGQEDMAKAVEDVLVEGKALKKAERAALVGRVAGLQGWSRYRGWRDRVLNTLAEGVRRGYTVDQILEGVPGEDYPPLRGLLNELEVPSRGPTPA